MEALRIVHQISGMDLEEARQQQARLVRQVRARAVFNLRKITLADLHLQLARDRLDHLLLRHLASVAAQVPFHQSQVA